MSYCVYNGCFHFKDDSRDYLSEIKDCSRSTDEQLDNHAIDIMNGKGYYDSDGKYSSYSKFDIYGEEIS